MNATRKIVSFAFFLASAGLFLTGLAGMGGCKADHSVDVRNNTPQPVYVQLKQYTRHSSDLLAADRLGPGDRRSLGPKRGKIGKVFIIADTKANAGPPATLDLDPGTTYIEIVQTAQDNSGRLKIFFLANPDTRADHPPQSPATSDENE